ncbi:MAG TPA: AAA family ATPase [Thermodesulfobacteriota bacterium]|nr:AAA family ATPase [Thermodesulfobacteriota bacterium]
MGKIISVANQKGGVGKTTTAVNLAASLAVAERRVLLIDFDPQGNASSGIGVEKTNGAGIYNAMIGEDDIRDLMKETELRCLKVVPSSIDLIGAEVELVDDPRREFRLKECLGGVADSFDYIFIDCPPSLSLLTVNALVASDSVLIPLQCEYYALEGISQILRTIDLIKAKLNPGLEIEGIVLTMFDSRNNLAHQVVDDIRKHFGPKAFKTIIPRNVRLSESPSFGKPVILYDIQSRGAISYMELAKELILSGSQRERGKEATA